MQIKCNKCGKVPTDQTKFAWKCNSCGKAYGMTLSALQQLEYKLKLSNEDIMCKSCGNILTDGKEQIYWKCQCGNLQRHTLRDFAKGEIQKENSDRKHTSGKNIVKILLFGVSVIAIGISMFFVGFMVGNKKSMVDLELMEKSTIDINENESSTKILIDTPEPTVSPEISFSDFIDIECEENEYLQKTATNISIADYKYNDAQYMVDEFNVIPQIIYNDEGERKFCIYLFAFDHMYYRFNNVVISSDKGKIKINSSFVDDMGSYNSCYINLHNIIKSDQYNRNYEKVKEIFAESETITLKFNDISYVIISDVVKEYREFLKIYDQMITTYKDNLD